MSRIRFGLRTVRVKTYELKEFNITKEEAESFAVDYDGFDLWNSDKALTVEIPQIEKRVKYFHIMFIPFFPVEVHWTIRNKNGLFKVNALCEQKVKSVFQKSYGPWYSFLAPIIFLVFVFSYFAIDYIDSKVSKHNYAEKIENDRQKLIKQLDSISTPFYLVLKTPFKYSNSFHRVDSIHNKHFYISSLPHEIDTIKSGTLDYSYHNIFKRFKLNSTVITKDSIHSIIPKSIDGNSYRNKNYKLRRIISVDELENPNIDFDFHLGGITIKNLGKPITLLDFTNNSKEENRWKIETNKHLETGKSIRAVYQPTDKESDESKLTFTFSDNEKFYEYEVFGEYIKTKYATAFTNISIEKMK